MIQVQPGGNQPGLLHKNYLMTLPVSERDTSWTRLLLLIWLLQRPIPRANAAHKSFSVLKRALQKKGECPIPPSGLYALAAIEAGASFINFTPSVGIELPALLEHAEANNIAYMGRDGKTGETLLKSVLAPMFARRNLKVVSWFGQNILGNQDGQVLSDPKNRASKIKSKNGVVAGCAGIQTGYAGEY